MSGDEDWWGALLPVEARVRRARRRHRAARPALEPLADGSGTRLRRGMRIGRARGPPHEVVEQHPQWEEQIVDGRLVMLREGAGVKAEAEA